jgi:hypothetical protein
MGVYSLIKTKSGVIPQNFLFGSLARRKKIYAAYCAGSKRIDVNAMYHRAHLVVPKKQMGFRIKSHFPRPRARKKRFFRNDESF